jgi:hypothetical protein
MIEIPETALAQIEAVNPELLFAASLEWNLKAPCNDCPFRRNAPDHEGICGSLPELVKSIEAGTFAHTCHKTDKRPTCDGPVAGDAGSYRGPTEHCAGALHFVFRAQRWMQHAILKADDDGKLDIVDVEARALKDESVFRSMRELLDYYCAMILRITDRKETEERSFNFRKRRRKVK